MTGKAKGATEDVATTTVQLDSPGIQTATSGSGTGHVAVTLTEVSPADVEYVVQMQDESGYWTDIATVRVAPRTKRDTVIKAGLSDAMIAPPREGQKQFNLRALDADSAKVLVAGPKPPAPPEWTVL